MLSARQNHGAQTRWRLPRSLAAFSFDARGAKEKAHKKKSAEKDRKGLRAPYQPPPPFEKGGRKLSAAAAPSMRLGG